MPLFGCQQESLWGLVRVVAFSLKRSIPSRSPCPPAPRSSWPWRPTQSASTDHLPRTFDPARPASPPASTNSPTAPSSPRSPGCVKTPPAQAGDSRRGPAHPVVGMTVRPKLRARRTADRLGCVKLGGRGHLRRAPSGAVGREESGRQGVLEGGRCVLNVGRSHPFGETSGSFGGAPLSMPVTCRNTT